MSKAALVLALLSFQAVVYGTFVTSEDLEFALWDVKKEVEDFTFHLETVFPNSHHAIDTITWQCHRVAETIQNVINKLKKEVQERKGERFFKQFSFALQEVHTSLQQIALSTDVNEVTSIKSQLISNLELACETLEKMVHITYVYYPDFRMNLKIILEDFLKGLRVINNNVKMEHSSVKLRWSPKELSRKIQGLTQSLLVDYHEHNDLLTWFLDGTNVLLKKLAVMETVGDDELDVVLLRLTRKIKKIVLVVNQAGLDREVKMITSIYFTDIASLFGQIVHYIENGSQNEQGDRFIEEVMYDYYHVLADIYDRLHHDKAAILDKTETKHYGKNLEKEFLLMV